MVLFLPQKIGLIFIGYKRKVFSLVVANNIVNKHLNQLGE